MARSRYGKTITMWAPISGVYIKGMKAAENYSDIHASDDPTRWAV